MAESIGSSLKGRRIVITRAAERCKALAQLLKERGAKPVALPLVAFADPKDFTPLDAALKGIEKFDWMILTSAQAVWALLKRSHALNCPPISSRRTLKIAYVGPVTAEAARRAELPVDYVAKTHNGVALAEELGGKLKGRKVILPRSDRGNPDLPKALKRQGANVREVIAYRTLRPTRVQGQNLKRIAKGEADAILFFSPSAVQHFIEIFGAEESRGLQQMLGMMAIGPVTARALREAGIERSLMADDTTESAVIEALEKHFANIGKSEAATANRG